MPIQHSHSWEVNPTEAIAIQEHLRPQVVSEDRFGEIAVAAGVDVGYEDGGATMRAAVAVLDFNSLTLLESAVARHPSTFPYLPGLLSFRESPAVLEAIGNLGHWPDLLFCDGHGLAHPRRFGLACHLGLLCDLPSIGVAKSRLIGVHEPPGTDRGSWKPLLDEGKIVGAALRTRSNVRPVLVSVGHRVSLESAIALTMRCIGRYRLPETTRFAHLLASGRPL